MSKHRPISGRQHAANLANAQKSTGPATEAGKHVSRANAVKHSLFNTVCVTQVEDMDAFDSLTRAYYEHFQPVDHFEERLLDTLIATHWNGDRIRSVEHGLYEKEFQDADFIRRSEKCSAPAKLVLGYAQLAEKGLIHTVNRHLARLSREFTRLMRTFDDHRRNRPPVTPAAPAPPIPEPVHCPQSTEPAPAAEHKNVQNEAIPNSEQPKSEAPATTTIAAAVRSVFNFLIIDTEAQRPLPAASNEREIPRTWPTDASPSCAASQLAQRPAAPNERENQPAIAPGAAPPAALAA